jgi:hypothetical protein
MYPTSCCWHGLLPRYAGTTHRSWDVLLAWKFRHIAGSPRFIHAHLRRHIPSHKSQFLPDQRPFRKSILIYCRMTDKMPSIRAPANLPSLVKTAFGHAKASGDLTYFPTQVALLNLNSVQVGNCPGAFFLSNLAPLWSSSRPCLISISHGDVSRHLPFLRSFEYETVENVSLNMKISRSSKCSSNSDSRPP